MGIELNQLTGKTEHLSYPKSDVLKFCFENGSWLVLRPSVTEPKIKLYFSINEENESKSTQVLENTKKEILSIIDRIQINN